ncbi:MAG: glucosaminidase domain-containing protein [Lutibacter sp.]|jgi:flagellar protein FlgJ
MTPKEFVTEYYPYAEIAEKHTGISAIAVIAQSALETGWGKSCPGNMMFGIKAGKNWIGKKQLVRTKEVHKLNDKKYPVIHSISKRKDGKWLYDISDWFRKYDTPAQSFIDHGGLILNAKMAGKLIYESAIPVRSDAEKFIEEIARSGYATDPDYVSKLKIIIKMIKKELNG